MISPGEDEFIKDHAYLPEHIPGYVQAISPVEPFLLEDHLCYQGEGFLIFVGYPLKHSFDEDRMREMLRRAVGRFRPAQVTLLAPVIPTQKGHLGPGDNYYKLDLTNVRIFSKVKNMIRRAARELRVERGQEFTDEHRDLISDFLASHSVDEGTRHIFERIPAYAASGPSVFLFNARNSKGELAGFDIAEFGARKWAFYLFNFRSRRNYVPGASDLLLRTIILEAQRQGKSFLNLGLGINPRVTFFKTKWGGFPFLPHQFLIYHPSSPSFFDSFLQGLRVC